MNDMKCPSVFTRKGIVTLSMGMLGRYPDSYMAMCGEMLILRAEHIAMSNNMLIHAVSPHFDVVPEGVIPPNYDVSIDIRTNEVTFIKRENEISPLVEVKGEEDV